MPRKKSWRRSKAQKIVMEGRPPTDSVDHLSEGEDEMGIWLSDGGVTRPTYLSSDNDRFVQKPSVFLKTVVDTVLETVLDTVLDTVFENCVRNLPKPGVGNLSETGVGNLSETGVGNLSKTGVGNLIETGVGNLSETGVGKLTETGVGNLSEIGVGNLSETGVGNLSEIGVGKLTKTGVGNLSETDVGNLTETGVGKLSEIGVGKLTETGVGKLSEIGVGKLTETGVGNLTETGVGNLTETGVGNLTETGVGNLTETGVGNLTETGAGNLTETGAGNLTETGVDNLSETGVGNLTETGVGNLSETVIVSASENDCVSATVFTTYSRNIFETNNNTDPIEAASTSLYTEATVAEPTCVKARQTLFEPPYIAVPIQLMRNKQSNLPQTMLLGSFHQGDQRFPPESRGSQCTINSLCALIYGTYSEISSQQMLDTVLCEGDDLYRRTIYELQQKGTFQNTLLCFDDIPTQVHMLSRTVHIKKNEVISGVAVDMSGNSVLPSLHESLDKALQSASHVLVLAGIICSAIFVKDKVYYFFDSHSHGRDGLSSPDGSSVLLSFTSFDDLIAFMYALYRSMLIDLETQYDILPLHLSLCSIKHKSTTALIDEYFEDQKKKCEIKKEFSLTNTRNARKEYLKNYMRLKRADKQYRSKERQLEQKSKQSARQSAGYKVREMESKRSTRENIDYRSLEKQRDLKSRQSARQKIDYRLLEKQRGLKSKQSARQSAGYKVREMARKRSARENIEYRSLEKQQGLKSKQSARQSSGYKVREMESKRSARENIDYRSLEKQRDLKSRQSARQKIDYRLLEKQRGLKSKQLARQSEGYKVKEMESKRSARENIEYRSLEKQRGLKSKQSARQSAGYKVREMESKRSARENIDYRSLEKQCDLKSRQSARQSAGYKVREMKSKRSARESIDYRSLEKQRDLKSRQSAREKENYRAKERQKELICKRSARTRPIVLEQERQLKQQWRSKKRNHLQEANRDKLTKSMKRSVASFKDHENIAYKRRKYGNDTERCIDLFHEKIAVGPLHVCSCCHQTWFKESVVSTEKFRSTMSNTYLTGFISVDGKEWICHTCNSSLIQNKTPRLSRLNGMKWPAKPDELQLFPLEERLVSLRIPFMQIRELPRGGQYSVKGNVVNVPVDIQPTIAALPRPLDENVTIAVKLKKKMSYQSCSFSENVRPLRVLVALHWLLKHSVLYKDSKVRIDQNWIRQVTESAEEVVREFVSNPEMQVNTECEGQGTDWNTETNTAHDSIGKTIVKESLEDDISATNNVSFKRDSLSLEEDSDTEDALVQNVGNMDTMLEEENMQSKSNQMYTFAPGEGQHPLSLYQDVDSEYLCFPTIFCGQRRPANSDRLVPVYYSDIAKWELRSVDRRAAQSVPNIFFKLKKIQMKQINDKVQLALRRCKTDGKKLTAAQVRDPSVNEQFVQKDEGYYIFKQLRNSPAYLETRKKDVFAMIRQLGLPTWFMSLSSADSKWTDLLKMLAKLNDNVDYSDAHISQMTWEQKVKLVQKDPVTCTRYFDHRVQQFISIVLNSWHKPIGHFVDFFYRVEFQQRGSPHIHMLVWVENAPKFGVDSNDTIVEWVDQYLSCSSCDDMAELIALQTHKHSKTCKKRKNKDCRFGYPLPPLPKTMVLEPLESEADQYNHSFAELQKTWNANKEGFDMPYNEFLESVVKLSEEEYIKCIRGSLNGPKVFMKREPSEMRVNIYNETVLRSWRANIDIQFVLDPYACAMYIVSYISKSQRGMSSLLDTAAKEARNGNLDLKRQVRHIGNVFSNSVEVGAQEAVYLVLQIPLTKSSRDVIFINTSCPEERTRLLKSKTALDELPPESTDVIADNVIQRYSKRPKQLENWCLADYVSQLEVVYPKKAEHTDEGEEINDDIIEEQQEPEETFEDRCTVVTLKNGIKIRKRRTPKVIRYVRFSVKRDEENHFREKLLLFMPWRNENDLNNSCDSFKDRYLHIKSFVDHKCKQYEHNVEELDFAIQRAIDDECEALDDMATSTQQENADAEEEGSVESESFVYFNPDRVAEHRHYDIGAEIGVSSSVPNVDQSGVLLSDEDYRDLIRCLNCKQRAFYNHVVHWLKTKKDPLFAYLSGGAGVGKSVVIKALYQTLYRHLNCKEGENPDDTRVLLCAFTGKAAFNINGVTIASAFRKKYMQSNQNLSCDELNTFRVKYRNLSVVIIDEISMVGNGSLSFIDQRLQELTGTKRTFGGVSIVAVGDFYQLMPVGDSWIFNDLRRGSSALAPNLWKENFKIFELVDVMRQKDDMFFAELLNRLRHNEMTEDDKQELKQHEIQKDADNYPSHVPHLFTENKFVERYNEAYIEKLAGLKMKIACNDTLVTVNVSKEKQTKLINAIPDDASKTANLQKHLIVAVGMIYDIAVNVNVEDGLTNGSTCELKHIENKLSETNRPSVLWVKFHDSKAGSKTRQTFLNRGYYTGQIDASWTPVFDIERTFVYNFKTFKRIQFPLKPSAGKTIHKAQGSTVDEIVVDMTQTRTRKIPHIHYVALSRVRSLKNLHILNFNEDALAVDKQVIDEMKRLRDAAKMELCYTLFYEINPQRTFKIAFNNSRSLHRHIEDVRNEPNLLSAHVIGIAESRLCDRDLDADFNIPGFDILRNNQVSPSSRPYHGLALYIRHNVDVAIKQYYSSDGFEFMLVQVCEADSYSKYQVIVLYKSPKFPVYELKSCMNDNLLPVLQKNIPTVLIGDFNMDCNVDNRDFLTFMRRHFNCTQKVQKSTSDSGSIIDLVFANCEVTTDVIETYWSDHKIVHCCVSKDLPTID